MEIFYDMREEWVTRLYAFVKIHQTAAIKICVFRCILKKPPNPPPPPQQKKTNYSLGEDRCLPRDSCSKSIKNHHRSIRSANRIGKRQEPAIHRKQLKICSTSPAVRKTTRQHFIPFGCTKILKSGNTEHW